MAERMLIMAGGRGQRLHPLTLDLPKPLLRVGGKPILEHTLARLRRFGIIDVTMSVAYLAPMIEAYFEDGCRFGLRIRYLHEQVPLGTAGALAELPDFRDTIFVANGDIISDIDFAAMSRLHRMHGATLTVASKCVATNLEFGVLDTAESGRVVGYREKPRLEHRLGIGMYVVEPSARAFLRKGERVDMPELIARLIRAGRSVMAFEHGGYWIDVGRPEDYARANVANGPLAITESAAAAGMARLVNS